jgi:hypothetical protein
MATTTAFDLNQAILRWRNDLAQSPAFQRENLAELESHLRESIAMLQARELSAEESFLIAVKRMGGGPKLEIEFGHINGKSIWLDRLFWVLVAFQGWAIVSTMLGVISMILTTPGANTLLTTLLPTLTIIVAAWVIFSKPGQWVSFQLSPLSRHPALFAMGCLVVVVVFQCLLYAVIYNKIHFATVYPFKTMSQTVFTGLVSNLPMNLVLAAWTFIVARKRLHLLKA